MEEGLQLSRRGPYRASRLSPFFDADGKELPILELTPDQFEICRDLVQKVDSCYYLQAAVMLVRDDGQSPVAMRMEVERSPSSADRELVTAGSSDNGSTRNFVNSTNERGDLTRVLYLSESYEDLAPLQDESSRLSETNGWDCSIGFLLENGSVVKGSVVHHQDCSVSFLLEDHSVLDRSVVRGFMVDRSAEDVSMVDAFD
jgi:hypothetical protein